jgi:Flp pilus assembly protein TadG
MRAIARLSRFVRRSERGAAAVEFALILPVLLVLVLGIVEFGHAFQVQAQLSSAARDGARSAALGNTATTARTQVKNSASTLNPAITDTQITVGTCQTAATPPTVTVTVAYRMPFWTGFFGSGVNLTGKGVMPCNP